LHSPVVDFEEMSRHTDALLGDLRPQASSSASTWFYAVLLILALGAAERVYRQISKANQKRAWELYVLCLI
jgi:hypothetical protein